MTRAYTYSPAALELMAAGVSLAELGRRLDLSPTAISRKLRGELGGVTGPLADLILDLAGSDILERIQGITNPEGAEPFPEATP